MTFLLRALGGRNPLPYLHHLEEVTHVLLGQLVGAANLAKAVAGARRTLADLDHDLVGEDPLARDVVTRGRLLAPRADLAGNGELTAREGARALEPEVGHAWVPVHVGGVAHLRDLRLDPGKAVLLDELLDHALVDCGEVADVVLGVGELLGVEWPTRPVREGLSLGKPHAGVCLHERGVAHLLAHPQECRRHLRVEDRRAGHAHSVENDLEVLAAGVEHLGHPLVREDARQGREVLDEDGVDCAYLAGRPNLDQAELGVVGSLAEKLRVHGNDAFLANPLAEGAQFIACGYVHSTLPAQRCYPKVMAMVYHVTVARRGPVPGT